MIFDIKVMNELYLKIANTINEIIPEKWYKVLLYAEIESYGNTITTDIFFYYYKGKNEKPVYIFDIPKIFAISNDKYDILENELFDYIKLLWQEFVKQKQNPWTNMTLELYSTGKFDFKYDYTEFDENKANIGQRALIWRYNNLEIKPTNKYDIEFLKKYLNKEEL